MINLFAKPLMLFQRLSEHYISVSKLPIPRVHTSKLFSWIQRKPFGTRVLFIPRTEGKYGTYTVTWCWCSDQPRSNYARSSINVFNQCNKCSDKLSNVLGKQLVVTDKTTYWIIWTERNNII